jgi:hypothetical protein
VVLVLHDLGEMNRRLLIAALLTQHVRASTRPRRS